MKNLIAASLMTLCIAAPAFAQVCNPTGCGPGVHRGVGSCCPIDGQRKAELAALVKTNAAALARKK